MIKLAFYGKGGIGKSTTAANLAAALAMRGKRVIQIGCDPKADSTALLRNGKALTPVLELVRRKAPFDLNDMICIGEGGVICVEAGGPTPGSGCAGRGIISALDQLQAHGAYDVYQPDIVLYDVLGDVVCGGFSMPMRGGYADRVYILTSGENMSIHAAANIAMALENFKERGYAKLGGFILNRRNVKNEEAKVQELADDFQNSIIGTLHRSDLVPDAEELGKTVLSTYPKSEMAAEYRALAKAVVGECFPC